MLMKNIRFVFTTVITAFFLTGLVAIPGHAGSASLVGPAKAKQMIDKGEIDLILDVRTPGEFTGRYGHIKNAKLIPVQELERRIGELDGYKDKTILVYCHSGARSGRAAGLMRSRGFGNIVDLAGGITAWTRKGYATNR